MATSGTDGGEATVLSGGGGLAGVAWSLSKSFLSRRAAPSLILWLEKADFCWGLFNLPLWVMLGVF